MRGSVTWLPAGRRTLRRAHVRAPKIGEPLWPPVVSLVAFIVLNVSLRVWLPSEGLVGRRWLLPAIELVLLVVLVAADPRRHSRRALRRLVLTLVTLLLVTALWATAVLIYRLITGSKVTQDPGPLLAAGTLVWLGNTLAFALLYWLMDGGGPISRASRSTPLDFAFTQQMSPELAPPGWRPRLPRLPPPRLHELDRVQPHRRHAAHARGRSTR